MKMPPVMEGETSANKMATRLKPRSHFKSMELANNMATPTVDANKRYSDRMVHRRKSLFHKKEEETNSEDDLGCMTPLQNEEFSNNYILQRYLSQPNLNEVLKSPKVSKIQFSEGSETLSPLRISPLHHTEASLYMSDEEIIENSTQTKPPEFEKQKTPHDTSTIVSEVPRLSRKSIEGVMKHNGVESHTVCKARTALFPEVSLPAKSFYPKMENSMHRHSAPTIPLFLRRSSKKTFGMFLCSRNKGNKKNKFGLINAGVKHAIRKPKKRYSHPNLIDASLNIMENSPLNSYFENQASESSENLDPNRLDVSQMKEMDNLLKEADIKLKNTFDEKSTLPSTKIIEKMHNTSTTKNRESNVDVVSKKRTRSPSPISNRKFFKFSNRNAVISLNNIQLAVDGGNYRLVKQNKPKNGPKIDYLHSSDVSDLIENDDEQSIALDNIISALGDEKENTNESTSPQKEAHLNVLSSKVSNSNILMSPTTQMCDMASGLAISSPKRAVLNINKMLNIEGTNNPSNSNINQSNVGEKKPLYPIFYPNPKVSILSPLSTQKVATSSHGKIVKQWKSITKDQMLLDAGQKKFGVTHCSECDTVYHIGDPGDELMHLNYHNSVHILRFNGWRHESVMTKTKEARIIRVTPGDPKSWWKKIKELMTVLNKDLGYYEIKTNVEHCHVYLYIKNRTIIGCLVAEPKSKAHKLLPSNGIDLASEESYPVKCGISRIWVSHGHRNKGIGSALMNCLKLHFIQGQILANSDIAMSSPTEMGKTFAMNYFKTQNFLIYVQ